MSGFLKWWIIFQGKFFQASYWSGVFKYIELDLTYLFSLGKTMHITEVCGIIPTYREDIVNVIPMYWVKKKMAANVLTKIVPELFQ